MGHPAKAPGTLYYQWGTEDRMRGTSGEDLSTAGSYLLSYRINRVCYGKLPAHVRFQAQTTCLQ